MPSQIPHRPTDFLVPPPDAALFDRVQKLAAVLPSIARDAAVARREAAHLRRENASLRSRLRAIGAPDTVALASPRRQSSAASSDGGSTVVS
jgi:hypothetical protein